MLNAFVRQSHGQCLLARSVLLFLIMISGYCCWAKESDDQTARVVEVSGAGVDVENAKNDAYREAVRQVVGAYVTAKTLTENDELIEDKVVSLSSGFVEKWEPLQESMSDGLIRVKGRATVRISKVLDSLKEHKVSVKAMDGESLGARLLTTNDQHRGTQALVAEAFEGFPARWFKASVEGEPRLGKRSSDGTVSLITTVVIEPDVETFAASVSKLDEALRATDRAHGEFEVDGTGKRSADYPTQEHLDQKIKTLLAGADVRSAPAATVLVGIDGRNWFPRTISYFDGRSGLAGGEPEIVPKGHLPVLFPTKLTGSGKRSTWKWYGITLDEAKELFSSYYSHELVCRTSLMGKDDEEVASNTLRLQSIGIGGMQYFEGSELYASGKRPIVIAPAVISRGDVRFLSPKFSCEREFKLEEDEVRGLTKVATVLQ